MNKEMTNWTVSEAQLSPPRAEVLEEAALAMAQATIQNAINASNITRAALATKMGRPRSFISRMLSGSHNLTIKTFARALAGCGFELEFRYSPIRATTVPPVAGGGRPEEGLRMAGEINYEQLLAETEAEIAQLQAVAAFVRKKLGMAPGEAVVTPSQASVEQRDAAEAALLEADDRYDAIVKKCRVSKGPCVCGCHGPSPVMDAADAREKGGKS